MGYIFYSMPKFLETRIKNSYGLFLSEFVLKAMGLMSYIFDTTPKFLETRIKNTKEKHKQS